MNPAIIGVLPQYEEESLSRFRELGFEPDSVTKNETETRFHFRVADDQVYRLASAISREYYSKRAIVGGTSCGNS